MPLKQISQESWDAFNAGDYNQAIACLTGALELGYSQNQVAYMSSFAHFAKGQFRKAFEGLSYRRQVMKDPFSSYPDWDYNNQDTPTLIWAPPGLGIGAEIMHLGFIQCLKPFPTSYCFSVDSRLVTRLQKMHPWAKIISRDQASSVITPSHCVTTILSLGHMAFSMSKGPLNRTKRIIGASSLRVKEIRQELILSLIHI